MPRTAELIFEKTEGMFWICLVRQGGEKDEEESTEELGNEDRGTVGKDTVPAAGGFAARECVARGIGTEGWRQDSLTARCRQVYAVWFEFSLTVQMVSGQ
jgi:hypothetical protein